MDNIDIFNRAVAGVLKKLYAEFPRPVELDTQSLGQELGFTSGEMQETVVRGNSIGWAIAWLGEEGFIRYSDSAGRNRHFANVVLTAKGLTCLNRTPESLEAKPTIGQQLKGLSVTASAEFVAGLVQIALRQ